MKLIPLGHGKFATVDDEDFERVSAFKWYYVDGYAQRSVKRGGRCQTVNMHRFVMDAPLGTEVDHKKLDSGLDNRRDNLRLCTHSQNQFNRGPQKNNTSGHKGVSWSKKSKKWMAQIRAHKKVFTLGYFADKLQAAAAYASAARELHGEFARTA